MDPWEEKTVLIVDDSEKVRKKLHELYSQLGMNVVAEAGDGVEALNMIKEHKPDLVSLDIIMPEMDGIECFTEIGRLKSQPKVVFVSCLSQEPKVVDAFKEMISPELFVRKDYSLGVLKSRMNFLFGDGKLLPEEASPKLEDVIESEPHLELDA